MRTTLRNRATMLWCAAIVLLAAMPALLLPAGAGWITDNGNKYIIMRSLAEGGTTAIANPAAGIDPEGRFFPDGGFHFRRFHGEMRSIYPEYFPALTLPWYRLFGERGVLVLPALGAMAAALLFGLWRRRMAAGLLLLAGTPLLFYGGTFWEMAPSVLFALTAVMLAVRRRLFLAGLVLGAGLILREEMYFLAVALAAGLLFADRRQWRGVLRFGVGFLVAALPLLLWQFHSFGHLLGLHGALYYSHNRIAPPTIWEQLSGFFEGCYLYLFQFNAGTPEFRWYYPVLFSPMLLMAAALGFSLALQLFGLRTLFGVTEETARLTAKLRSMAPEVVISDLFFLPEQTPQLFFEKRWLFVKNDEAAAELPVLLARHGIREAVLVLSPRFRNLSDGALRRLLTSLPLAAPPERFAAPVSGFLELFLGKVRLQSP